MNVLASFRNVTVTGLLAVGALAATTLPAFTSAPASASTSTLIGSSAKGGPTALAALESKLGRRVGSHRVYNPGFRVDILNDHQVVDDHAKGRTTVYSVKLPWAQTASGGYDASITQMARLLKADGRTLYLAFSHEPEDNGDPALFRAAFARFGRLVHAVGASNVHITDILMEWTFNPRSGRTVSDWIPPTDSFDVLALDIYINPQKVDRTFAQATAGGEAEAARLGKQFAVAEWGVVANRSNPAERAATVSAGLAHAKAAGFAFVTWFQSDIGVNAPPEGWYLDSNNDHATVAAFATQL